MPSTHAFEGSIPSRASGVSSSDPRPSPSDSPHNLCRNVRPDITKNPGFAGKKSAIVYSGRAADELLATSVGASPPPRVTEQRAREAAGEDAVYYGTKLRGASNGKAKTVLGFKPRRLEWLNQ
jgi:hypothetical protein